MIWISYFDPLLFFVFNNGVPNVKRRAQAVPEYLFTIALLMIFIGIVAKIFFSSKSGLVTKGGDILDTTQNLTYEEMNSTAEEQ